MYTFCASCCSFFFGGGGGEVGGTKQQKATNLVFFVMLLQIGAFCLSEASCGSDAFALKTKAVADGDDYIISGDKMWITNGGVASIYLVFANADFSKVWPCL